MNTGHSGEKRGLFKKKPVNSKLRSMDDSGVDSMQKRNAGDMGLRRQVICFN